MILTPATRPTLHFIGVTTGASSIMQVFPAWARHLGLADAEIRGIDFPLHAPAADYRAAVAFIRDDPLSLGALVTTHKIDLFHACHDMFDHVDRFAALMQETSCISKRDGRLICHAKDPISSGLAIDGFLAPDHFRRTGAEVFAIGAGGSSIALTWHLMQARADADLPARIVVSDRDPARLEEIRRIHAGIDSAVPRIEHVQCDRTADNDTILAGLRPGSLVINATGLGKDAPGSPLGATARFPHGGVAWDLNYRGDLLFLDQARAQAAARDLAILDGWTYFIHGWTQVIAEVFDITIGTDAATIDRLTEIARTAARRTGAA